LNDGGASQQRRNSSDLLNRGRLDSISHVLG
jgi:hypothetical protein